MMLTRCYLLAQIMLADGFLTDRLVSACTVVSEIYHTIAIQQEERMKYQVIQHSDLCLSCDRNFLTFGNFAALLAGP